jgi:hypothetical protein
MTTLEFSFVGDGIRKRYSQNVATGADGAVYLLPSSNGNILQISPSSDGEAKLTVACTVNVKGADDGETEGDKNICQWCGSVTAGDGVIYTVPFDHNTVLRFDPSMRQVDTVDLGQRAALVGYGKYRGCVVGADGNVHAIPFNATSLLKINTETCVVSMSKKIGAGLSKWAGGALASDGCIYCAPYDADHILKIDTNPNAVGGIAFVGGRIDDGVAGYSNQKYDGAVVGSNGKIYFVPHCATRVLEYDPRSQAMRSFGELSGEWFKWGGGVLTSDGFIHCIPNNACEVLSINLATQELTKTGSLGYSDNKWSGGSFVDFGGSGTSEGRIVCAPEDSEKVLVIKLPSAVVGQPVDDAGASAPQLPVVQAVPFAPDTTGSGTKSGATTSPAEAINAATAATADAYAATATIASMPAGGAQYTPSAPEIDLLHGGNEWSCAACTYRNEGQATHCMICSSAKTDAGAHTATGKSTGSLASSTSSAAATINSVTGNVCTASGAYESASGPMPSASGSMPSASGKYESSSSSIPSASSSIPSTRSSADTSDTSATSRFVLSGRMRFRSGSNSKSLRSESARSASPTDTEKLPSLATVGGGVDAGAGVGVGAGNDQIDSAQSSHVGVNAKAIAGRILLRAGSGKLEQKLQGSEQSVASGAGEGTRGGGERGAGGRAQVTVSSDALMNAATMANQLKQERDDAKRQLFVVEDVRKKQAVLIERLTGTPEVLSALSLDEIDAVIRDIEGSLARAVSGRLVK